MHTFLRLLQTSDDTGVSLKNALTKLSDVINQIIVKLEKQIQSVIIIHVYIFVSNTQDWVQRHRLV